MATHYELTVRGHLHPRWSAAFDGLAITHQPDGTTTLAGPVADQAALYGLLSRARDLNLTLIAVRCRSAARASDEPAADTPARAAHGRVLPCRDGLK